MPAEPVKQTAMRAYGRGLRELWRQRRLGAPFLAATLLQGAAQTLVIYAITQVLRSDAFLAGALLVLGLWLMRAGCNYVALVWAARISHRVEIGAMETALRRMLRQPLTFFDRQSRGDLVVTGFQDTSAVRVVTVQAGRACLYVTRIVALGVAAWILSPKLTLIGLAAAPLALWPALSFGSRIRLASDAERAHKAVMHDNFLQVARSAPTIRLYGVGARMLQRARSLGAQLYQAIVSRTRRGGRSTLVLEAASGVGLALLIGIGGHEIHTGRMDWQALLGILMALLALYQPMVGLLQSYNMVCTVLPSLEKLVAFGQRVDRGDGPRRRRRLDAAPERIHVDGVSFAYGGTQVLEEIDVQVRRGETIGIVGATGAGKSTLLSLLMGMRRPTQGAVRFDGVDIQEIRSRDLFGCMSFVPQEPVIFLGTIRENIALGRPDASAPDVEAAARGAHIHEEIVAMPEGYETLIGPPGIQWEGRTTRGISVGQRQRIAIASALLRDAPIVFLDEPTSNVDPRTESRIQEATDRLLASRTAFVVAHRLETVRRSDRILVLADGRVVGFDAHDELIRDCPTYQALWAAGPAS